ncbi:hypothetical protein ADIS_3717 [Lunatimonas lonarensis]|uniref:Uncharacterized protein n=1 Tax=Lunatimonas lonarensis TaxID=1232681 RepID=R7ZNY1_9BACT|nr:hypothetical protein ADIS_3717 [Lunatimonas lonarensis]
MAIPILSSFDCIFRFKLDKDRVFVHFEGIAKYFNDLFIPMGNCLNFEP